MDAQTQWQTVERVTEIYVAVFPVSVNADLKTEVILAGYKKDPDLPAMSQLRATVETQAQAVEDLVALCDEIVEEQKEIDSYRLLKFDQQGVHVLSPADYRTFDNQYAHHQWGIC